MSDKTNNNMAEPTNTPEVTTNVATVEMDIDDILGFPAPEGNTEVKPNIFSKESEKSFLDNTNIETEEEDEEGKKKENVAAAPSKEIIDDILNPDLNNESEEEPAANQPGRKKVTKEAMVEVTKKLIEKNLLVPFKTEEGEEDDITQYSVNDFESLLEENIKHARNEARKEAQIEFFEEQPEEVKVILSMVANGATSNELKNIFKNLSRTAEIRELDPSNDADQEAICRTYLGATHQDWTPEEIEDELNDYKDRGVLANKAQQYKPKLDSLQEEILTRQMEEQEAVRRQKQQMLAKYQDSLYKTLAPGELNGLKLDKKKQVELFTGLVQPQYQTLSGNPTNLLGHLLEKYQYVEPNHGLIAEALWLLSDPEGYRSKVKEQAKKDVTGQTVRMLKTEERNKASSSGAIETDEKQGKSSKGIPKPTNFFRRG